MLTVIAIIVCASGITTVLVYHNFKITEIELHKLWNSDNKNIHSYKKYHELEKRITEHFLIHIFFVFPLFIVLYSVIIWILSVFFK